MEDQNDSKRVPMPILEGNVDLGGVVSNHDVGHYVPLSHLDPWCIALGIHYAYCSLLSLILLLQVIKFSCLYGEDYKRPTRG